MRVVQINSFGNLSTGSVMRRNHERYVAEGHESWMAWGRTPEAEDPSCEFNFGSRAGVAVDGLLTRLDGRAGFHSRSATKKLLGWLDEVKPDLVHLHNLHGYYVNVEMLFEWLAAHDCRVEWTLHDCWAFTGHCAYFTYVGCDQWKTGCASSTRCPQLGTYPKTLCWTSCATNYKDKRSLFTRLPPERVTLVTPSQWLADLVRESFLSKYPVEVRYNVVDCSVFRPTPSDFRARFGIGDRFMVLGVASTWTERKGLSDFVRLARELDSERCAVVLVGLSKKQIGSLERELVALPRAACARELAEAYTAADVFVHPGVEETYGLTVAEAQACGTPVIVAEGSACAEIADKATAMVVPADFSTLRATVVNLAGGGV